MFLEIVTVATNIVFLNSELTRMISRKENILNRPWQERRYASHRRKVQSALPAIDNRSPPERKHVKLKLKKQQLETERCQQIENNNFLLLKRMNYIMKTSYIDNKWTTPQPNFLGKIALYNIFKTEKQLLDHEIEEEIENKIEIGTRIRKSKCFACTFQQNEKAKDFGGKVLEPCKKRSQSVPVRKLSQSKQKRPLTSNVVKNGDIFEIGRSQKIVLKRGNLNIAVNFPPDTNVEYFEGKTKKTLNTVCNCKKNILT